MPETLSNETGFFCSVGTFMQLKQHAQRIAINVKHSAKIQFDFIHCCVIEQWGIGLLEIVIYMLYQIGRAVPCTPSDLEFAN